MKNIDQHILAFQEFVNKAGKLLIFSHTNPDGDALGSSLSFKSVLQKLGKEVDVIIPDACPDYLKWMPGVEGVVVNEKEPDRVKGLIAKADLLICLDFNALNRVAFLEESLKDSKAPKILVDHHPDPQTEAFDVLISLVEVSSTSELIYHICKGWDCTDLIGKDEAECIYTGICTDTGSFSYACDYPETFEIVADLIKKGAQVEELHRKIYDNYDENRLRLLGFCLAEKLKVFPEEGVAYISLTKDELKRFSHKNGDTEGIVNYGLSMKGVHLAVMFTERSDRVRISFRSKGKLNVNKIARAHFNGGGHKKAAGGRSQESLKEVLNRFEALIPEFAKDEFLADE